LVGEADYERFIMAVVISPLQEIGIQQTQHVSQQAMQVDAETYVFSNTRLVLFEFCALS
jgi:hypothetical protein